MAHCTAANRARCRPVCHRLPASCPPAAGTAAPLPASTPTIKAASATPPTAGRAAAATVRTAAAAAHFTAILSFSYRRRLPVGCTL